MSSDDITRLEKYLTRESDLTRTLMRDSRKESALDHAAVRKELGQVKAQVEEIARRINTVEDTHAQELAHDEGAQYMRQLIGRLTVNLVSIAAAMGGLWFLVSDHIK